MTTLASAIIADAGIILNDAGAVRFTNAELLSWLNAGQVEIATLVPNSNAITLAIQLVAGVKQSAPADALRIVEFVRNMGANGQTPGPAIYQIERKDMDAYERGWASDSPSSNVVHAMYNAEDDNKTFYVWPPQSPIQQTFIEIIYAQTPAYLASANSPISISDYYRNPLLDYILYRAFSKDSEFANQAKRSQTHRKAFGDYLGIKYGIDGNASNAVAGAK